MCRKVSEINGDGCLPLTREVDFLRSKKDGGREKVKKLLTVDLYTEKSVFSATKYNHI